MEQKIAYHEQQLEYHQQQLEKIKSKPRYILALTAQFGANIEVIGEIASALDFLSLHDLRTELDKEQKFKQIVACRTNDEGKCVISSSSDDTHNATIIKTIEKLVSFGYEIKSLIKNDEIIVHHLNEEKDEEFTIARTLNFGKREFIILKMQ